LKGVFGGLWGEASARFCQKMSEGHETKPRKKKKKKNCISKREKGGNAVKETKQDMGTRGKKRCPLTAKKTREKKKGRKVCPIVESVWETLKRE